MMTDEELNATLRLSYYREVAVLNRDHNIMLVQHVETSKTYVKKVLSMYNKNVYLQLYHHPVAGIPRIIELGELNGLLTVIEEYISGSTLHELMNLHGTFSEQEVIQYTMNLCDILTALHGLQPPVIHRDIKPSNIILTNDNRIVLIDLNGAKLVSTAQTQDTCLIGTQGYAAPEQYGFGASNIQTDLYCTGRLMNTLLTGSPNGVCLCSKALVSVIRRCTQIEPKKRYISAAQLKNALQRTLHKRTRNTVVAGIAILILCSIVAILTLIFRNGNENINLSATSVTAENTPFSTDNRTDFKSDAFSENTAGSDGNDTASRDDSLTDSSADNETGLSGGSSVHNPDNSSADSPGALSEATSPGSDRLSADAEDSIGNTAASIVGAYSGNDGEILVLTSEGYANYYCYNVEFAEFECPYFISDDKKTVTISLAKCHCDITADIDVNRPELIFKSTSANWNSEVFEKISDNAELYIIDPPSKNKHITVSHSGEASFTMNGLSFTVPKQFIYQVTYSGSLLADTLPINSPNAFFFTDVNADNKFSAFVLAVGITTEVTNIYTKEGLTELIAEGITKNYVVESSVTNLTAGRNSTTTYIRGNVNEFFSAPTTMEYKGSISIISDEDDMPSICLVMLQSVGTGNDDTEAFRQIMDSITVQPEF